jgi:hypothetical protein
MTAIILEVIRTQQARGADPLINTYLPLRLPWPVSFGLS